MSRHEELKWDGERNEGVARHDAFIAILKFNNVPNRLTAFGVSSHRRFTRKRPAILGAIYFTISYLSPEQWGAHQTQRMSPKVEKKKDACGMQIYADDFHRQTHGIGQQIFGLKGWNISAQILSLCLPVKSGGCATCLAAQNSDFIVDVISFLVVRLSWAVDYVYSRVCSVFSPSHAAWPAVPSQHLPNAPTLLLGDGSPGA